MASRDFSYKGRTITVLDDGQFEYFLPNGAAVRKPSLKAARQAIDKEMGAVIVTAMNESGKQVLISGKHRLRGYVAATGEQVGHYSRIIPYNEEAAARLIDIRQREYDEQFRHREATRALHDERQALYRELGDFDYDAEAAKIVAQPPA